MSLRNFFIIIAIVMVLDQLTKAVAVATLAGGPGVIVIPDFFHFTYRTNTGAAWSMFSDRTRALTVFATFVAVGLMIWGVRIRPEERLLRFPLALILGGAIGNLVDRWRLGHVTDFIDFHWQNSYHFPTFNVADSAICVGMGILIFMSLRSPEAESRQEESAGKATGGATSAKPQT